MIRYYKHCILSIHVVFTKEREQKSQFLINNSYMNGDGEVNSGKIVFNKSCKQIFEPKCYFLCNYCKFPKEIWFFIKNEPNITNFVFIKSIFFENNFWKFCTLQIFSVYSFSRNLVRKIFFDFDRYSKLHIWMRDILICKYFHISIHWKTFFFQFHYQIFHF